MNKLNKIISNVISIFNNRYNHDLSVKSDNLSNSIILICNKCQDKISIINKHDYIAIRYKNPKSFGYVELPYTYIINNDKIILSYYLMNCEDRIIKGILE